MCLYIHIHISSYIILDSYGGFLKCGYPHIKYQKPMVTSGSTIAKNTSRSVRVQAALRRPDSHRRPGNLSIWGRFGIPWYTKLIEVCMVLIDIPIIQCILYIYKVYHGIFNIFQMIYHDIQPYKCRAPDPLWAFSVCTFFTCMLSSRGCGTGSAQMFVQRGGGACWRPLGAERGSGAW